jgi:hypothetical protein
MHSCLERVIGRSKGDKMSDLTGNFVVNRRLVKVFGTNEGGLDVQAYDATKDEFYREFSYLSMIMFGREDIQELSEEDFEEKMSKQR